MPRVTLTTPCTGVLSRNMYKVIHMHYILNMSCSSTHFVWHKQPSFCNPGINIALFHHFFFLQWNYLLGLNPSLHSHRSSAFSLSTLHNDDYWCLLSFILNCRALVKQPCRSQWKSGFFVLMRVSKLGADLR